MPICCGVDIVEIDAFARSVALGGERFLHRIYTEDELAYCRGRLPQLAARFAAKEAFAKALGTGIRGVRWQDIEVRGLTSGRPILHVTGAAAKRAGELKFTHWSLSLSHSEHIALAFVIVERDDSHDGDDALSARLEGAG